MTAKRSYKAQVYNADGTAKTVAFDLEEMDSAMLYLHNHYGHENIIWLWEVEEICSS